MEYYTVKEVARKLNRSEEQVRRYIRQGLLTATMRCKKDGYYISQKAIDLYNQVYNSMPFYNDDTSKEIDALLSFRKKLSDKIEQYQEMIERIDAIVELNTNDLRKGE